jgi:Ala-tRNA(Pro) deacylase
MQDIYSYLDNLDIKYDRHEHAPVFTVEEADKVDKKIPGAHTKNLFLRNKKGTNYYLVILPAFKQFDLNSFSAGIGDKHLSFASPKRLEKYLGVKPGSVTPFGLINDRENTIKVYIDKELTAADRLNFHPCRNDATLSISTEDFTKFLDAAGNHFELI